MHDIERTWLKAELQTGECLSVAIVMRPTANSFVLILNFTNYFSENIQL